MIFSPHSSEDVGNIHDFTSFLLAFGFWLLTVRLLPFAFCPSAFMLDLDLLYVYVVVVVSSSTYT